MRFLAFRPLSLYFDFWRNLIWTNNHSLHLLLCSSPGTRHSCLRKYPRCPFLRSSLSWRTIIFYGMNWASLTMFFIPWAHLLSILSLYFNDFRADTSFFSALKLTSKILTILISRDQRLISAWKSFFAIHNWWSLNRTFFQSILRNLICFRLWLCEILRIKQLSLID